MAKYQVKYDHNEKSDKKWKIYKKKTFRTTTVDKYKRKKDARQRAKKLGEEYGHDVDVYDKQGRNKTQRYCNL